MAILYKLNTYETILQNNSESMLKVRAEIGQRWGLKRLKWRCD